MPEQTKHSNSTNQELENVTVNQDSVHQHTDEKNPDISPPTTLSSDTFSASKHDDTLTTINTASDEQPRPNMTRLTTTMSQAGPPHSIFTPGQKKFIVFMASWAGFFSPVSANIYFPALNSLAMDLKVSSSLINLTLTSYMIFQGLAPAFMGSLADSAGRRPAYFVCFIVYIAANIGLALQDNYAALFVLRCLQSTGSSATIAMASGVVSDVSTPSERGAYMGFTFAGSLLGPAIGPVLGGILAEFLGWRSIFWFLAIFAGTFLVIFGVFFPETARSVVGNGSVPPKGLNMSFMNYLAIRKARQNNESAIEISDSTSTIATKHKIRFPNPLSCLQIIWDKQNAMLLLYNSLLFAAFYDVTAIIPSQFSRIYHFNDLQIGLCYIPFGVGSMLAALVNGQLLDRNFKRWCDKLGVKIRKGRDQSLKDFPIEKVRIQVALPATYLAIALVLIFGWVLNYEGPLAVLLVILFFASFSMSIAFNCVSTLLVDFYPQRSATATAANNLSRCLLGAGATGVIIPMIEGMGIGWAFTLICLVLIVTSPILWLLYFKGMKWREERRVREEATAHKKEMRKSSGSSGEEGKAIVSDEKGCTVAGLPDLAAIVEEEKERHTNDTTK